MRKSFFGAITPIVLLLSSVYAIIIPALPAYAADNTYQNASDNDKAELYRAAKRMYLCYKNADTSSGLHIGMSKITGGNIFQTGDLGGYRDVVSGISDATDSANYANTPVKNAVSCGSGDNVVAHRFFSLFNINDYINFVCTLGYNRVSSTSSTDAQSCIKGSGDFRVPSPKDLAPNFKNYVLNITGSELNVDSPSLYTAYKLADDVLWGVCINKAIPDSTYSESVSNTGSVSSSYVYIVDFPGSGSSGGNIIKKNYIGEKDDKKLTGGTLCGLAYGGNDSMITLRNRAFDAYFNDLKSQAEAWCTSTDADKGKYGPGSDQASACVLGALTNGSSNPCKSLYSTPIYDSTSGTYVIGYTDTLSTSACTVGWTNSPVKIVTNKPLSGTAGGGDATSTCSIDGVGWILCPVLTFMAGITDSMFGVLANLLSTNTSVVDSNGGNNGIYIAWGYMRNIANIAFVLAFMLIIFSQITNIGLKNYGIKKMLPRLVIAAILVNVSFYICQIAVDLSNVLGYGLKGLFDSIGANIAQQASKIPGAVVTGVDGVGGFDVWKSLTAVALVGVGGAVIWSSLGALVSILLVALISVLTIFLLMILRQMLIILLIVIAPLAFVAFILPNTQTLFKKWQKLFTSLLMLFPIVSAVFGASALASTVLKNVYAGSTDSIGQIVAAGVLMVPLIIVPSLLKASLDGAGKLGSMINGAGGKIGGALGKKGSEAFGNSRLAQYQAFRKGNQATARAKMQGGNYEGNNRLKKLQSAMNKKINTKVLPKLGKQAEGFAGKLNAAGDFAEDTEDGEAMKAAHSYATSMSTGHGVNKKPLSTKQLIGLLDGQDAKDKDGNVVHRASELNEYQRRAITELATSRSNSEELNMLLGSTKGMSTIERKTFVAALGQKPDAGTLLPSIGGTLKAQILEGSVTSEQAALEAVAKGKYSIDALTKMEVSGIEHLIKSMEYAPGDSDDKKKEKDAAKKILQGSYAELANADPTIRNRVVAGGAVDIALQGLAFGGPIVNVSGTTSGPSPQSTVIPVSGSSQQQTGPPAPAPQFPGADTTQQSPNGIFVVEHFKPKEPKADTSGASDETK